MKSSWITLAAAAAALTTVVSAVAFSGCADNADTATGFEAGAGNPSCPVCVSDQDCNGGVCAQFGSDIFCAPACPNGNECSSDRTCTVETSASGDQVSVCVPNDNACGSDGTDDQSDAGCGGSADAGDPNQCGTLVGPPETAGCSACAAGSSSCQANGCFGGWWCDTATNHCQAPPTSCPSSGSACQFDAGSAPITGNVDKTGGKASRLYFGVIGDTRPASPDRTDEYPTSIITKIYQDMASLDPKPLFAVTTGDYMFATPGKGNAGPQLDLYLGAQGNFPNVVFPAMGNHECTGATDSNCAAKPTENASAFYSKLLGPISQSKPYYSIEVDASDGSWTSKIVFVAANAWDDTQASWLDSTLAKSTTYTFIVRHESAFANTAPGVTPSETIIAKYPYTALIVGHAHTYGHYYDHPHEMLVGNGGAPLSGSKGYGFGLVLQRDDGTIQFDVLDYQTKQFDPRFRYAVHADGSPAPL